MKLASVIAATWPRLSPGLGWLVALPPLTIQGLFAYSFTVPASERVLSYDLSVATRLPLPLHGFAEFLGATSLDDGHAELAAGPGLSCELGRDWSLAASAILGLGGRADLSRLIVQVQDAF